MAKAPAWMSTDAEARKRGEQTGLDTLVVHALKDECYCLEDDFRQTANALSTSPGEYDRKVGTQRNWRGPIQVVEHVV